MEAETVEYSRVRYSKAGYCTGNGRSTGSGTGRSTGKVEYGTVRRVIGPAGNSGW